MKKTIFAFLFCVSFINAQAQYNNLWIPDTLSGTNFNLNINSIKFDLKSIPARAKRAEILI